MHNQSSAGLRDRVGWFSQQSDLRTPMVTIIDAIQTLPGHIQILASALAFYTLCKGAGLDSHDIVQQIERMERNIDAPYANQFKAMKEYAKHELNEQ